VGEAERYRGERLSWAGVAGYYSLARLLVVTMDDKVRSNATTLTARGQICHGGVEYEWGDKPLDTVLICAVN